MNLTIGDRTLTAVREMVPSHANCSAASVCGQATSSKYTVLLWASGVRTLQVQVRFLGLFGIGESRALAWTFS